MSSRSIYIALIVMSLTVYAIRVAPFLFLRKPIRSVWFRSFLYYVPYVTLAVMTFPAMLTATGSLPAGIAAFAVGCVVAWFKGDLFSVAISCCVTAFVMGLIV